MHHDHYFYILVYLILGQFTDFLGLLMTLFMKGLLDTGEYFVVSVDLIQYDSTDPEHYIRGERGV